MVETWNIVRDAFLYWLVGILVLSWVSLTALLDLAFVVVILLITIPTPCLASLEPEVVFLIPS